MKRQIEIGMRKNAFHFIKPEEKTAVFLTKTMDMMPVHASLFPFLKLFQLVARLNKKLQFHLFAFVHSENKLTANNFITKCFTNLGKNYIVCNENIHKNLSILSYSLRSM